MKGRASVKEAQDTRVHWVIMDHLCRFCGGRVLVSIANKGMTPGGNAIHRCADCGSQSTSTAGYIDVCWCGQEMKRNNHMPGKYMCVPFSVLGEKPWLKTAFLSFGCDPARGGDVGIMTRDEYERQHEIARSLKDGGKLTFEFGDRPAAQAFLEWFGTHGSLAFSKHEREEKKDEITRFDYSGAYKTWGYDPDKHGLDFTVKAIPPSKGK